MDGHVANGPLGLGEHSVSVTEGPGCGDVLLATLPFGYLPFDDLGERGNGALLAKIIVGLAEGLGLLWRGHWFFWHVLFWLLRFWI